MRAILILIALVFFSCAVPAQQLTEIFGGRFTTTASTHLGGTSIQVSGVFKHSRNTWEADSIEVGDLLIDCECNTFVVSAITSVLDNSISMTVTSQDASITKVKSCTGGIVRTVDIFDDEDYIRFPNDLPTPIIDCILNYNYNINAPPFEDIYTSNDTLYVINQAGDTLFVVNDSGINNLSDVDTTGLSVGDILQWNGTTWIVVNAPIYTTSDTSALTLVYAPSHGLTDTISFYGYVPVKADFTRANSTSVDSAFIAYAIDAPHPDSLLLMFSGFLNYLTWHGKELNTQYHLQDDGSEDITSGTVSMPTAIASDSTTLFLREVGVDIAGRLRRIAMPSPLITAFGGNPASPTDTVVQLAISTLYLPAGLAQPGTIFTLSYPTQSYNPTYQQTVPNTNPLTPSYAWLWDGVLATRIVTIPVSVNLQDVNYGVLNTLVLLPIDSLGSLPPTDSLVAMWLDTNYTVNNLRIANGSLLYYIGDGTRQSPDYIWQVIDDISYDASDTNWEKIIKKINQPGGAVPAIRNDLPSESILIDPNNNDLVIGADSLDNTGEIEFYLLTPVDSQNVSFFIGQRDSSSVATGEGFAMDALMSSFGDEDGIIGINFDYFGTVWNTAMFGDSMLVSSYPGSELTYILEDLPRSPADTTSAVLVQDWSTKRVYVRDANSFADGNGMFDAANNKDTTAIDTMYLGTDLTILTNGNTLSVGNILQVGEIFPSISGLLVESEAISLSSNLGGTLNIYGEIVLEVDNGVGNAAGFLVRSDGSESFIYGDTVIVGIPGASIFIDNTNQSISLDADTIDATNVTTFLGFPSGGADGNGLIDALPAGNVTIDGDGNNLLIDSMGVLTLRSMLADTSYSSLGVAPLAGTLTYYDDTDTSYAYAQVNASVAFIGFSENTAAPGAGVWAKKDTVGIGAVTNQVAAIEITNVGANAVVKMYGDTLDVSEVATLVGFPGDAQTLSTSNDTLTISGGNSVKLPITELLRDSVTTTTLTIDLETRYQKVVQIDMASATNLTLTINNPTNAGVYTFHFIGTSGTDNVTWPAAFLDAAGTALGTDALTTGTMYTCYYSSTDAKYYCK